MEKITSTPDFEKLCEAWLYLSYNFTNVVKEKLEIEKIRNEYFDLLKNDDKLQGVQKRIYEYIQEFGSYKLELENIESCYIQYTEELFDLYEELEIRKSREVLDRISKKDRNFLRQIAKFFSSKITKEDTESGE